MPWAKFRKKPVVIDAILWDGLDETLVAIRALADERLIEIGQGWPDDDPYLLLHTLDGKVRANKGDWIIRGVCGELSPCKPYIFEASYEGAE